MTFRLSTKESGISINAFPLLTHSQRIYGTLVETYGPYPRDYMSECRYSKWYVPILLRHAKFVNGGSWKKWDKGTGPLSQLGTMGTMGTVLLVHKTKRTVPVVPIYHTPQQNPSTHVRNARSHLEKSIQLGCG